jgi:hypothetical protein
MNNDPVTTQIQRDLDRLNGRGEFAVPAGYMHLSPEAAASLAMSSSPPTIQVTPAGSFYISNPLTPNQS